MSHNTQGGRGGRGGGGNRGGRGGGGSGSGQGSQAGPRGEFGSYRGDRGGGQRGGGGGRGGYDVPYHSRGDGGGGRGGGGGGSRPPQGSLIYEPNKVPNVDAKTKDLEEKAVAALKKEPKTIAMPARPAFGTKGRAIVLWTNYFKFNVKEDLALSRYSITVLTNSTNPKDKGPTGKRLKRIIDLLMQQHIVQHSRNVVTDFKANLLIKSKVDLDGTYTVNYSTEGEDVSATPAKKYSVQLEFTGLITVAELLNYVQATSGNDLILPNKEEIIQALNILVGFQPKTSLDIASYTNKYFAYGTDRESFDLGGGLLALRGFFTSVRPATGQLLVNVQVKNGAFFQPGMLDALMLTFRAANSRAGRAELWTFIKKITVDRMHLINKNKAGQRVARVTTLKGLATPTDGLKLDKPPRVAHYGAGCKDVEFWLNGEIKTSSAQATKGKKGQPSTPCSAGSGRYISVFNYFKEAYPDVKITDPSLPVLNVGSHEAPSYVPPDVCKVLPGQAYKARLSPEQTQNMIKFAVRAPAKNAESIVTKGCKLLGLNPLSSCLQAHGVQVGAQLMTVPGRVLMSPAVLYGSVNASTFNGSWNMRDVQLGSRATIQHWGYLVLKLEGVATPWRDANDFEQTLGFFQHTLSALGIRVNPRVGGKTITINSANMESKIDQSIKEFSPHCKILLVVLPNTDASIYAKVKHACDVKFGIINVCVNASKFKNANSQYHANVGLKFNLKLGGVNQALDKAKLGVIAGGKTMVAGIDVTHPAPGSSESAPSVASIVASINSSLAQFPADLRIQTGRKEMVTDLQDMFKSRLLLWFKHNRSYPENILVYRDGVSEGQYKTVLEAELPALREACKGLYSADLIKKGLPKVTIVIVGKRHNTRFYPTSQDTADKSSNPCNGTVVDRVITEAGNWDFFLQSHTALQGTARPAHYYVIYDQIFRDGKTLNPADTLEELTHNMCYLYGRATKAVSICPPAYYADLACERARCFLGGMMDIPATQVVDSASACDKEKKLTSVIVGLHENVKDAMVYI